MLNRLNFSYSCSSDQTDTGAYITKIRKRNAKSVTSSNASDIFFCSNFDM